MLKILNNSLDGINFSDLEKFLEEEDPLNGGTILEMLIEARKIIMPTWDQNCLLYTSPSPRDTR